MPYSVNNFRAICVSFRSFAVRCQHDYALLSFRGPSRAN
ncbi:transporter, CorA family domain protein [Brucella abortus]|nr:transporter, CorA family domain protein [Brucella abortus]